jgi:hypothetical protein
LAAKPILIPRVWGIEDSSRNWSIYMTLAHLIMVHDTIADIIEHLAAGQSYAREVRTADVKPGYGCDAATVDRFQQGLTSYLARTSLPSNLCTRATHVHPWFGPLNAHQWHCLAALHETIHRRQIERIVRLLPGRQGKS